MDGTRSSNCCRKALSSNCHKKSQICAGPHVPQQFWHVTSQFGSNIYTVLSCRALIRSGAEGNYNQPPFQEPLIRQIRGSRFVCSPQQLTEDNKPVVSWDLTMLVLIREQPPNILTVCRNIKEGGTLLAFDLPGWDEGWRLQAASLCKHCPTPKVFAMGYLVQALIRTRPSAFFPFISSLVSVWSSPALLSKCFSWDFLELPDMWMVKCHISFIYSFLKYHFHNDDGA